MAEPELLEMLSREAARRVPAVKRGLAALAAAQSPDPAKVEELRVDVHGLKGAAMVIGQTRLGRLAERSEQLLAAHTEAGTLEAELATRLSDAMNAFEQGSRAAAVGEPEPPSVAAALAALS